MLVQAEGWMSAAKGFCIGISHAFGGAEGVVAAFEALADAGLWREAIFLAAACLAQSCQQPSELLVPPILLHNNAVNTISCAYCCWSSLTSYEM